MDIGEIPLFSMLQKRLGYVSERERVIAQNVANADTAGYVARDLKPFTFDQAMGSQSGQGLQPAMTAANHLAGKPGKGGGVYRPKAGEDSETTLNGNAVVLEDQMIKMSEARMDYDAAIGFYQKSLALLRMAARAPGR